ncbi:MAG: preprotein translocase subunit SecE [Clostridia bacterium]|nr:preprotein translocase subunit SecE [Clostridia bacterium]
MAKSEKNSTKEEKVLTKQELKEQKKQEKLKAKKAKEKKEKKGGLFRKLKEAWSELKKVTWPTFATVVKKTGVVILVVLIFTVVIFGIDYLLGLLYNLFLS